MTPDVTGPKCLNCDGYTFTNPQQLAFALTKPVRTTPADTVKPKIGFVASMLGPGLIAISTTIFIYFARSSPAQDLIRDGTEPFVAGMRHQFVGPMLTIAGLPASLIMGDIAACSGSRVHKGIIVIRINLRDTVDVPCVAVLFGWTSRVTTVGIGDCELSDLGVSGLSASSYPRVVLSDDDKVLVTFPDLP